MVTMISTMRAARRFLPPSMSMSFRILPRNPRCGELEPTNFGWTRAQIGTFGPKLRRFKPLFAVWNIGETQSKRKAGKKEASKELPDGQHIATIETFDEIIRKVRNYREQDQAVCPTCRGFGDREENSPIQGLASSAGSAICELVRRVE